MIYIRFLFNSWLFVLFKNIGIYVCSRLKALLVDGERIEALNFIWGIRGFDYFAIRHKKVMKLGGFSCQTCIYLLVYEFCENI